MSKASKSDIQAFLDIHIHQDPVEYNVLELIEYRDYKRCLISYTGSENDRIPAYLFVPKNQVIKGAILVHHQHNAERHLGKSEVAGIAGDSFQAFCPIFAKNGIITLAPDSISFEDRRSNTKGIKPSADEDDDVLQHYNEMAYRLLRGTTLMKKVIEDASIAISLLDQLDDVPKGKIGVLGHSYGGNTVIFQSPFDVRINFSCSSGAVCSYQHKFIKGTGIELAEVIPGFTKIYDIQDLIKCVSPRSFLIVAGTKDIYSEDAEKVFRLAQPAFKDANAENQLELKVFQGGHSLTQERFDFIVAWFLQKFN